MDVRYPVEKNRNTTTAVLGLENMQTEDFKCRLKTHLYEAQILLPLECDPGALGLPTHMRVRTGRAAGELF